MGIIMGGCPLFGGSKCIRTIGKQNFGTSTCVLCREVYYIVSLSRRVHYQRFHCIGNNNYHHHTTTKYVFNSSNSDTLDALG